MEVEMLLTMPEAARRLGVTEGAIRKARLEGRLPTVDHFGRKLIPAEALEEYRQRTRPEGEKPRGRPRTVASVKK